MFEYFSCKCYSKCRIKVAELAQLVERRIRNA